MKRGPLRCLAAALLVYCLLLALLLLSERSVPGASIQSFGDALWYSLVTLSTVGYGDLYPVSAPGRVIGFAFVLLSVGVLAAAVSALLGLLRERLLPMLRLRAASGRKRYLFSALNEASLSLGRDLARRDGGARLLFCAADADAALAAALPPRQTLLLPLPLPELARSAADGRSPLTVFLIGESAARNYADAQALLDLPVTLYCRGPELSAALGLRFFDAPECCARQYWGAHPLSPNERRLVLLGSGPLARALLDQAILVNCRVPFLSTEYHLFGDWTGYRELHPGLRDAFSLDGEAGERDALLFHGEDWRGARALLERADRLILCEDETEANTERAALLRRYFALDGALHVAAPPHSAAGDCFGSPESLFTAELVMHSELDRRAVALHRAYCRKSPVPQPGWEELSPFLRASNRAAADSLPTKLRMLLPEAEAFDAAACQNAAARWRALPDKTAYRRNEHERWLRFHYLYNWRYGEQKDAARRTHPCLRPFEELSAEERAKDDAAWEQLAYLFPEEEKS